MNRLNIRTVIVALMMLGAALIIIPALANNDDYGVSTGANVAGAPINPPPTQSQKGQGVQTAVATIMPTAVPATSTPVPPTSVPPTSVPPTPVPPTNTPESIDPPVINTPEPVPTEPPLTYTPVGA